MIAFLEGTIASKDLDGAIIAVGGMGYKVLMSARALDKLPAVGEETKVITKLVVKEDGLYLYGFLTPLEQQIFEKLTGVSGVGPKAAMAVLGSFSAEEIIDILHKQDVTLMQRVPGIGKKTASRIILELKDSFDGSSVSVETATLPQTSNAYKAAQEALLSMGFTGTEVDLALQGAPEDANEQVLLQYSLKRLGA